MTMAAQLTNLEGGAEPFPGYELHQLIGRGTFGEVWRASSPGGKRVALKFLRTSCQRAATRELRALQSIRQLKHPNLMIPLRIWADSGYVVVSMELAEGSLLDLLDICLDESGQALPIRHVCFYLKQAASALDFLNARHHQLNGQRVAVRHCDVKPSNLLVIGSTVKLADFSFTVLTASQMWYYERVGTLHYAAPEVFQGWLSDRTDQFALAITYFQMRTGCFPFPDPPNTFDRNYTRPLADITLLDEPERPIIARALSAAPQDRWPSCTEMIARLHRTDESGEQ